MYTYQEIFYNEIKNKIMSGELKIGDKLPTLRELSDKYHLGKTTVHSGIVQLERAGFVVVVPRLGVFVNDYKKNGNIFTIEMMLQSEVNLIDKNTIRSLIKLKKDIEPNVMKSAALTRTDSEIEVAFRIYEEILNEKDIQRYAELKFKLYKHLWSCADNELYIWLFNSFKKIVVDIYLKSYSNIKVNTYDDQVEELLLAIKNKDGELAYNITSSLVDRQLELAEIHYLGDKHE